MPDERTRREWLKEVGAIGAGSLFLPQRTSPSPPLPNGTLFPLTSSSDVFVPPRGRAFQKFSFDFPEPAVAFEGLSFAFRIFTGENTYTLDARAMRVRPSAQGIDVARA